MPKLNAVSFCLLILVVFGLSACKTSGYSSKPWVYNPDQAAQAQKPPASLSDSLSDSSVEQDISSAGQNNAGFDTQRIPQEPETQELEILPIDPSITVKVGILLPLSGQHEKLGQAMFNAAQMALFDVGHTQFELIPRDTRGTPEGARQAAREALDEGAELILGPVFSSSVRAAAQETRRRNVNMIAYSTDWNQAGNGVFIMGFLPFDQVQRIVQYAAYQGFDDIAVVTPSTDYGNVVTSAYQAYAGQYNVRTAKIEKFPPMMGNLSPLLRKFTDYDSRQAIIETNKASGGQMSPMDLEAPFDAVLMPVGGEMAISISNLLSHYDLPPSKVKRLGTGLFDDIALSSEDSLKDAWFAAPSPELRRYFEGQFTRNYGITPPRLASLAYDSTALAAILAKRGLQNGYRAAFDQNSIMNANGFAGIDGIFRFRSDGTVERGLAVLEFRKGRFVVIDPAPKTFEQFAPF